MSKRWALVYNFQSCSGDVHPDEAAIFDDEKAARDMADKLNEGKDVWNEYDWWDVWEYHEKPPLLVNPTYEQLKPEKPVWKCVEIMGTPHFDLAGIKALDKIEKIRAKAKEVIEATQEEIEEELKTRCKSGGLKPRT